MFYEYNPKLSSNRLKFIPFVLCILLTFIATVIFILIREVTNPAIIALLFLLPVSLSSVLWGLLPGVLSAILAFLSFNFFFIPPYYSLMVHRTQDFVGLVVFLGVAVLLSNMMGRAQESLKAATEREREASRLYELSKELAGLADDQIIVDILALHLREAFRARRIEVILDMPDKQSVKHIESFENEPNFVSNLIDLKKPDIIHPLQMADKLIGEVHLWRDKDPFSPSEKRLLQTIISQSAPFIPRF